MHFFYLIEQHSKFYLEVCTCLTCSTCSSVTDGLPVLYLLHTHPVSWNWAYHLRIELSDGGCFPNLVRNCRWTIVTDRHSWNVSTQNAFSLPFAAILVNRAPSGEIHNYCTPHIIKENFENFLIHRCNYILLSQVYCVWQVVKTQTIIFHNPVYIPIFLFYTRGMSKLSSDRLNFTGKGHETVARAHSYFANIPRRGMSRFNHTSNYQ